MTDERMIGHYRVIELLGSGAMGTVHVAVDTYIDRPVAIKALRPELTQDPEFASRFRAEAKSLARLNHPNIATLFSPVLEGSELYLVMELVRGRQLDEVLRDRGKPLGVKESLAIIAQAADGLSYAHETGVIHRDIKPSNLMISNDGRVKIMDFGIARVQGSVRLTRSGTAVGTPLYMSPEQCRGGEGDERSDLYSLAIVLYEMLSGAPPFSGATEYDLIQAQIKSMPAPLVTKVAGISPALEAAIMTALAKRPDQRFQSVRAFSDAIGATVMRPDATGIIRNATHLIAVSQDDASDKKAQTSAFDVAKSRVGLLTRRFKTQSVGVKAGIVVLLAAAVAIPSYLWLSPSQTGAVQGGTGVVTRDKAPGGSDAQSAARGDGANTEGAKDNRGDKATVDRQAPSPDKATLADLRSSIKGTSASRIRASDFEFVTNGVKVRLLAPAKSLAAAGNPEGEFVLGMLLLETPDHVDLDGAFSALSDAAKQDYPDAQANLGLIYQKGVLPTGRDLDKAAYWFSKASDNGDAKAQFWLGCYYQYGWGRTPKDLHKSIEQFSKAIAGNYDLARESLEVMTNASNATSPCLR